MTRPRVTSLSNGVSIGLLILLFFGSVGAREEKMSRQLPFNVYELNARFEIIEAKDVDGNGGVEAYRIEHDEPDLDDAFFIDVDEDGTLDCAVLADGRLLINEKQGWIEFREKSGITENPNDTFTEFEVRVIAGGDGGAIAAGGVYTFEVRPKESSASVYYTFAGIGLGGGLKGGAEVASPWCDFSTKTPMSLSDFEGFGRLTMAGAKAGVGGGYSCLCFYPTDKPWICIECFGFSFGAGAGLTTLGGYWDVRD